jgi:outer membrane protein assembly factor BamB
MIRLFVLLLIFIPFLASSQIAQWRGPERDGIYQEKGLADVWPATGPQLLLAIDGIGTGWSSPVTNGKAIYVTGKKDSLEYLTSIDFTGKINWQVPFGIRWAAAYPDSRCTPTLEGNKVYVQSGTGRMSCFDATTGKLIWSVEVDKIFKCFYDVYGGAEAPLIIDNKIISSPMGTVSGVVALDKNTGKVIWQSKPIYGRRSFASPILYKYKNFKYILTQSNEQLVAVNADNGEIMWTYQRFKGRPEKHFGWNTVVNTPIFKDDEIFITKGYHDPSIMLKMAPDGKSVSVKWKNPVLDCHIGGVVMVNGYIYGSNWTSNDMGNWACEKWDNGQKMYETNWINKGSIIFADNKFYCFEEKSGNVALVKPNPNKFELVSSFKVNKGSGMYWAHPMINDGKLFIRHGTFLLVYNIKK